MQDSEMQIRWGRKGTVSRKVCKESKYFCKDRTLACNNIKESWVSLTKYMSSVVSSKYEYFPVLAVNVLNKLSHKSSLLQRIGAVARLEKRRSTISPSLEVRNAM